LYYTARAPGHKVDRSTSSPSEDKNEWSYNPMPLIRSYRVDMGVFNNYLSTEDTPYNNNI